MSDTKTASWIAALERARTELEGALAADEHWRALRGAVADPNRSEHEQALAGNPVYRCWEQLNGAIEALQRQDGAGRAPGRHRIALRDVLERIRSDAVLQDAKPLPASSEAEWMEPVPVSDPGPASPPRSAGNALLEPEEATVSFVIREPARVEESDGERSAPGRVATPETPEPEADLGVEAEVVIVTRRRR